MLDKELKYFNQHRDEFVKDHPEDYVVIVGEMVFGFFHSEIDAYSHAITKHELGTFLIKQCVPESDEPVANFYTASVTFA